MRDATQFEARGIPAVILVNDVFEPIAHATATLLALPANYVSSNIVWLPHPTSNLQPEAAAQLVDERIGLITSALLGAAVSLQPAQRTPESRAPLELAREIVAGLAQSLQADGAELALLTLENGVLAGEVRIGGAACEDGSCVMPPEQLAKMIEAMVRPAIPALIKVALQQIDAFAGSD